MVTLLDHGNSSGSVSIDASTYRTHRFTATGALTIGAPSGLDDGESVRIVVTTASGSAIGISLDAAFVGPSGGSTVSSAGPVAWTFTKVGGVFVG